MFEVRRSGAVALVVAVLALVMVGTLPARSAEGAANDPPPTEVQPSFDVDDVVEQASHAVEAVPGEAGSFEVADASYRASFDPHGFAYSPAGARTRFGVQVASVTRGRPLALRLGKWSAERNVASRPLADHAQERVTARSGEIEWDVVLSAPPAGGGDLVVRADITGTVGAPVVDQNRTAWRLGLVGGSHVEVGQAVVLDAAGAEVHRALPRIRNRHMELVVPSQVLEGARYPLTIDPTVSGPTTVTPEVAVDPSVAFDGEDFLVAWSQLSNTGGPFEVFAAQVNGAGTAVQPVGPISVTGDGKDDQSPDVTFNGSRFLVVWQHDFSDTDIDVKGRLVTRAGFPVGGELSLSAPVGNQTAPAVTAVGTTFFAVWGDSRTGAGDIYGGRVTNAGAVLDPNIGRPITSDPVAESNPDVATNQSGLLVTYEYALASSNMDVYARPVTTSVIPSAAPVPVAQGVDVEQLPRIASDGSQYLVVWVDDATGGIDVSGQRIAQSGALVGAPIPVSSAPSAQKTPDVAYNGTYLVAWRDNRDFWGDIYTARVASDGTVQDPNGLLVYDNTGTAGLTGPAVAAGPGNRWAVDYDIALSGGIQQQQVAAK